MLMHERHNTPDRARRAIERRIRATDIRVLRLGGDSEDRRRKFTRFIASRTGYSEGYVSNHLWGHRGKGGRPRFALYLEIYLAGFFGDRMDLKALPPAAKDVVVYAEPVEDAGDVETLIDVRDAAHAATQKPSQGA
jgi:hypothetical protein